MNATAASAPGKAVLSGEYAVLEGAPALAMAVNVRARVRIAPTRERCHRVVSCGTGTRAAFRGGRGGSIEWLEGAHADFSLLEHVWRTLLPEPATSLALALDTRDFFDPSSGAKLGFGSSAALTVALVAALSGDGLARQDLYTKAARAHASFQAGQGSGVDVATAVHGGVIGFSLREMRVEAVRWPRGLALAFLWSGRPADTAARLERLSRTRAGGEDSVAALVAAADVVHARWREGAGAVLASLRAYTEALLSFSDRCDLGVFDAGHRELFDAARAAGVVYKPCGAGGGDVGAVFAEDRAAAEEFARWAGQRGFRKLAAVMEACGATREVETA